MPERLAIDSRSAEDERSRAPRRLRSPPMISRQTTPAEKRIAIFLAKTTKLASAAVTIAVPSAMAKVAKNSGGEPALGD